MTFIVGDIHGEITKLKRLIDGIDVCNPKAALVFIGDYLDKGEDVLATLHYLTGIARYKECIFLMGNHEYLWMNFQKGDRAAAEYLMRVGAERTLLSIGASDINVARKTLLNQFPDFFDGLSAYWKDDRYLITHSGVDPAFFHADIASVPVERLLFNRYDFIRHQELFQSSHKVIFGHTGFYYPYVDEYKIGIDTAACFLQDQQLTAFCLEENYFINSLGKQCSLDELSYKGLCPNIPRVKPWRENARF
jgi:serine/threonine protein phosphatase 1